MSLLAINQAFTWTTTVTSQIDIGGKRKAGLSTYNIWKRPDCSYFRSPLKFNFRRYKGIIRR
ncbi:hypothetical protein [Candidatus Acidianus copahuensis]|nr:hypothetical protein [Candidatus Acidianus copahuensis]